jgi:hypothetical protein
MTVRHCEKCNGNGVIRKKPCGKCGHVVEEQDCDECGGTGHIVSGGGYWYYPTYPYCPLVTYTVTTGSTSDTF